MTLTAALADLEQAGTDQNRKVYARHGVGPNQYGVSMAALRALTKRIKTDHPLALAASEAIGVVDVDHGATGCKTPDAAAYIHKTLARRAGR